MNIRTIRVAVVLFGLVAFGFVAPGYAQAEKSVAVASFPVRLADTDGKRLLEVLAAHHIHTNTFGSHSIFVLVPSRKAVEARQLVSELIETEGLSLKVCPQSTPRPNHALQRTGHGGRLFFVVEPCAAMACR